VRQFAPVSDLILLDTKVIDMPGVGATGKTHDWDISRRVVEAVSLPVILAGGLDASNVVAAATIVKPWGVDSNTRTNLAGDPVAKDMQKVREFVLAVRAAEANMDQGARL
jgi:phosphoribosylanthranilate isomerase